MPKKPIEPELEKSLEEDEEFDPSNDDDSELEAEIPEEKGEVEESKSITPDFELRKQKKRILDKIEAQVNLSQFWQEVLGVPAWENVLRTYYRLNAGLVQRYYASFTAKAVLVDNKIEWTHHFFDSDGKEVFFDAENEAGVKE